MKLAEKEKVLKEKRQEERLLKRKIKQKEAEKKADQLKLRKMKSESKNTKEEEGCSKSTSCAPKKITKKIKVKSSKKVTKK